MRERPASREDLLTDSQATLRQVWDVLSELTDGDEGEALAAAAVLDASGQGTRAVRLALLRTYSELVTVAEALRRASSGGSDEMATTLDVVERRLAVARDLLTGDAASV